MRRAGLSTVFDIKQGSLKKQLSKAAGLGARYCIIFDEKFRSEGLVVRRDMRCGKQDLIRPDDLLQIS